ncbi:ComEC/Rec2 family competence protein [Flavobacterium frigoris]|uniref:Competence protein n=1 Tax=Flavobacterium frigoris (strain PS1) TaxID=1086011 RepID=H7FPG0_FLAFP|nr:ComEC/Rec2 family competence protein [Flavobacterium frigoris]EIA09640.1 competence protein [Flavobacterium frigoris PS1]
MKVLQFPLARITIGFIVGILAAFYLKPELTIVFGSLFVSLIILAISYFVQKNTFTNTVYFGIGTFIVSFFIGITTQIIHTDYYKKSNYINESSFFDKPHHLSVVIREKIKSTTSNDRYIALINQIDNKTTSGRILLNVRKDSLTLPFETGTFLHITGTAYKNKPPNNPNQFDYSAYLQKKQIYAQLYSDKESISIGSEYKKDIWYYSSKLRTTIIHNLQKSNFNKRELNVAIALILGQKQDISPEIIQDYQYAGAIHILSVSGLHIGFILLFITFVLKPIPNTRKGSLLKLSLILFSLCSFALIAGLATSVVRSVTMFSFVAIGYHLRRSVNIYHTILVSIFLILLFQPSFLFDVGFQLSYIALFFIIWFQPLLASIWTPKTKAFGYMWGILTVSFAAQIGTLPLSIYYFHQFPGLFFITNLVIIPLLSVLMILGVLVMVLAAFNFIPLFLSKPLEWGIYLLNRIINSIASFEQFIIRDIPFNIYLMASCYLLILASIIWFKKPSYPKLIIVLIAVTTIQVSYVMTHHDIKNENEWVVFNLKKNTMITTRNGENVVLYSNDSILKTAKSNSVLKSYLIANFSTIKSEEKIKNTAFFKDNKILILDSLGTYPKDIKPDIILITQSPRINIDRMLHLLKPRIVVADASNFKTLQKHWKSSCEKQKIPFHAVAEKGYFKLN